jgi:hypothetical protein
MRGVIGRFLELIGGFILVAMLPIVSMGGNGGFGEHFSAVALYLFCGAIPLLLGLKLGATSKATAIGAIVIGTLAGVAGTRALVHALFWIRARPNAILIWCHGFTVVRRIQSSSE